MFCSPLDRMTLFSSSRLPAADPTVVPSPAPADLMAARLAARVEALEAEPIDLAPHRRVPTPERGSSLDDRPSADVDDLNRQLELLRDQLEAAFGEVDARIDAAAQRVAAAEEAAAAADTRAQVASARAANVLYAVDDLAHELKRIAGSDHTERPTVARLLGAVGRLRNRLQLPAPAVRTVSEVVEDPARNPAEGEAEVHGAPPAVEVVADPAVGTAAAPAEPAAELPLRPPTEPASRPTEEPGVPQGS